MLLGPLDCEFSLANGEIENREHQIREVSQRFGISLRTIRFYEQLGLIKPRRTASRYRLYDLADVARIAFIVSLRKYELPVPEIAELLTIRDEIGPEAARAALTERLEARHAGLCAEIDRLEVLRDDLRLWIDDIAPSAASL